MDLKLRLRAHWDELQSSLWFQPAIYLLAACVLGVVNPYLDALTAWRFYSFGHDNARTVLGVIASSMLTVVTLTFSILMVSFTLASQQFSPRILRNFTRDQPSQHVLGIQIAIFLYSLLVMVRLNDVGEESYVPLLSVLSAIGFSLAGVGAFIYFIDHISRTIRVNYIIANIGEQTVALLQNERPTQLVGYNAASALTLLATTEAVATINAERAGYVQSITVERLVALAQRYDLLLELTCMTGDFVPLGRPLLRIQPVDTVTPALTAALLDQFDIGTERTTYQDLLFGIRQLVDIAIKALSPAVNDPTTAMNCLDYLTNILLQAVRCNDGHAQWRDQRGVVRLLAGRVSFAAMVDLAFNQIRHYGSGDVLVDIRMIEALAEIAGATADGQRRELLWQHIGMVSRNADRLVGEPYERQQINDCIRCAVEQMGYDPSTLLLNQTPNDKHVGLAKTANTEE